MAVYGLTPLSRPIDHAVNSITPGWRVTAGGAAAAAAPVSAFTHDTSPAVETVRGVPMLSRLPGTNISNAEGLPSGGASKARPQG